VSEWGNPAKFILGHSMVKFPIYRNISVVEGTRGTETSQYPEEEKLIKITLVAESETVKAQTAPYSQEYVDGVVGPQYEILLDSKTSWNG
jgi:hypothetical protein